MPESLKTLVRAFLAGICIAIGGTIFLKLKNAFPGSDVVGAILFTVGLFAICTRGYDLFTGKASAALDEKPTYLLKLLIILFGNFLGCLFIAEIEKATGLCGNQGINMTALAMVEIKMAQSPVSLIVLGFLCNVLIFIAVNGFKNNPHQFGKYLALFLGVTIFILAGTEHSIADMYYWLISGVFSANFWPSIGCLALIVFGNFLGAVFIPILEKITKN